MVMGRPRKHDREKIATELIEWAAQEDSLNLNAFCCTRNPPIAPSKITEWSKECENFREAYEAAKAFVGDRRERYLKEDKLHVKAYDLNARVYDHFLSDNHKSEKRYEKELETELQKGISEDYEDKLMKIAAQLQRARDDFSSKKSMEDK